ncbi:MAG TPA: hypothetical protein VIL92_12380 [Gaiellaceae bacterium]|jgi:hypothetical protein
MSVLRSKKKLLALAGAMLLAGVLAGVGISALTAQVVVADFTNIHMRVVSSAASDFDSGWHFHSGLAIVQVQKGSLQISQGTCTPKTVSAGETSIEIPFVPVRATATGQVVWTTTFLVRYEDPVTTPVTPSPCP